MYFILVWLEVLVAPLAINYPLSKRFSQLKDNAKHSNLAEPIYVFLIYTQTQQECVSWPALDFTLW